MGQVREVGAQGAAVHGGEVVRLHTVMGGDQKIREDLLARSSFPVVALENLPSGGGGLGGEGTIDQA
jgi:hypothetical protein